METRDQYVEKLKTELDSINAGLDMYEARLRKASADTQAELQDDFDRLRKKRDEFTGRVEEMKESGSMAMDEVKSGAQRAAAELRRSLERARERM